MARADFSDIRVTNLPLEPPADDERSNTCFISPRHGVRRCLAVASVAVLGWCGGMRPAGAQVITGTVEGRVRDSQGGVLPAVTITAVNTGTSASFVAATTTDGLYRVPYCRPAPTTSAPTSAASAANHGKASSSA
jgi:hypothetical protein